MTFDFDFDPYPYPDPDPELDNNSVMSVFYFSAACGIAFEDSVVITGGAWEDYGRIGKTVSVYTVEGWQEDLPSLNIGRIRHACSSYWVDERKVQLYRM